MTACSLKVYWNVFWNVHSCCRKALWRSLNSKVTEEGNLACIPFSHRYSDKLFSHIVVLSLSSVVWYWPHGSDALQWWRYLWVWCLAGLVSQIQWVVRENSSFDSIRIVQTCPAHAYVDDTTLTEILARNQSSCLDVYLNALHQSVQFGCVVRQVSLSSECLCLPAVRFHSQHIRCVHCVLHTSARQNNINCFMAIVQLK